MEPSALFPHLVSSPSRLRVDNNLCRSPRSRGEVAKTGYVGLESPSLYQLRAHRRLGGPGGDWGGGGRGGHGQGSHQPGETLCSLRPGP